MLIVDKLLQIKHCVMRKLMVFIFTLIILSCNAKQLKNNEITNQLGETSSNEVASKTTYTIKGFSDRYYGKVSIEGVGEDNYFSGPGWVAVYDAKSNKELFRVNSEELAFELHDGEVKANISELPYGEQSVLMYDDFNFDGIGDFAIMDGHNSCYGGPSFDIYLAKKNGSFEYSDAFSRLSHEYCGMFNYDESKKELYAMAKSGCCWHRYSRFVVKGNIPEEVEVIDVEHMNMYVIETIRKKDGDKMSEVTNKQLDFDGLTPVLKFTLENKKTVCLFPLNESLNYVLMKEDGNIEFDYYFYRVDNKISEEPGGYGDLFLQGTSKEKTLTFSNDANTTYEIYETPTSIGVNIYINKKKYNLKGVVSSKEGSLSDIKAKVFENVIVK